MEDGQITLWVYLNYIYRYIEMSRNNTSMFIIYYNIDHFTKQLLIIFNVIIHLIYLNVTVTQKRVLSSHGKTVYTFNEMI